jgi:phytoene dehydrogenase-like protein
VASTPLIRHRPGEPRSAVVVGSGPNGLAAAITLAESGYSPLVLEAAGEPGGGSRSAALTLPGYTHDVCATVHALTLGSSFFRHLPLGELGVRFAQPALAVAHPFDDGTAAVLDRSIEVTGESLGSDARAYRQLMSPLVAVWETLIDAILGPLRWPSHPLALARFGRVGFRSARGLAEATFVGERARALFAGLAAHAMLPLDRSPTAAFGLVLGMLGHAVGWPFLVGGSQRLADALVAHLTSLGGTVLANRPVASLADVPPTELLLFDLTPRQVVQIAAERLPAGYADQLRRYRYGPGVFKLDWALDGPVPWRAPECWLAGTVHLGGTFGEIAAAELAVWHGQPPERPYVLVCQPSVADPTRAPAGKHTLWAYCHVPNGSREDMTGRIEAQIERFAPGFRERILARAARGPAAIEQDNANYVGGDINGGVQDLRQLWTRPTLSLSPYRTPAAGIYLCSSSTPPGGGVHGMCGYWAARSALASHGRVR